MTVGQRIKARRLELGLTAQQVGDMIGKAKTTVCRYETSEIESMPLDVLIPLANALRCTPGYFLGDETDAADTNNLCQILSQREDLKNLLKVAMMATPEQIETITNFVEGMIR